MLRMGVLSDTHIPVRARSLPGEIFTLFEGLDLIVHCGDINTMDLITELETLGPVRAVYGNTDPYDVAIRLPPKQIFTFGGVRVGICHGHGMGTPRQNAKRHLSRAACDLVIYGHSHCPEYLEENETVFFNPGSVSHPRCTDNGTVGIIEVDGGVIRGQIIELEQK